MPLPVLPPELPVVNDPVSVPVSCWKLVSKPITAQLMIVSAGNGLIGVQVRTVSPALQAVVTAKYVPALLVNIACEKVDIAVLKVKTTLVVVATPVAPSTGLTDTIIGCAWS